MISMSSSLACINLPINLGRYLHNNALGGRKGCSFEEFCEHPFPMFKGNMNTREARSDLQTWRSCYKLWIALRSEGSSILAKSSLEKQGDGGTLRGTLW
jgi:hypothetical protein